MSKKALTARSILDAVDPEDIFGSDIKDVHELTRRMRELVREFHPDRASDVNKSLYGDVTAKILTMRERAEERLTRAEYGKVNAPPSVVLKTPKASYEIGRRMAKGDLCDIFNARTVGSTPVVVKIARRPEDRDLLENEAKVLAALWASDDQKKGRIQATHEEGYWPYFIENTSFVDHSVSHPTNILAEVPGETYTLEEVMRRFPEGLDMVHASWMLRRLLEGLYWTHKQGYVHGAILPSNILIMPENHGIRILDWCYAVKKGDHIRAVVTEQKDMYPPEVWAKLPASPATDVYMAAMLFRNLCKRHMPRAISNLLKACTISNPRARIETAFDCYQELNTHLIEAYGRPKFRTFKMPPVS